MLKMGEKRVGDGIGAMKTNDVIFN